METAGGYRKHAEAIGGNEMVRDVFTFIVGGKAGEGVKKAGTTAANMFAAAGRHVFQMDDYPSLISGGHNFSAVSTSTRPVDSHYLAADLVVALDARSYELHRPHVADGGVMVFNSDAVRDGEGVGIAMSEEAAEYPDAGRRVGVAAVAALAAAVGLPEEGLGALIEREYRHDLENNTAFARSIYASVSTSVGGHFELKHGESVRPMLTGNQAIALGAAAAGLDMYIGYPMTPASTVLHYLAAHASDLGVTVVHPESEIAVANMAVGAAAAGARVMVGTSGGGFALMEEAFSFAGMAEAPFLCVLSSRPGPSTGVPTYTEQADLRFALGQGHGEFPRLVASPGSVEEAFRLSAEMLELVWSHQAQGLLLTEKHLSESRTTVEIDASKAGWAEPAAHEGGDYRRYLDTQSGVSPLLFPPSRESMKWSSYEHDENGITTEDGPAIAAMHDKRNRKGASLTDAVRATTTVNRYGESGPIIFTYGSTTLSVLEALRAGGITARVVQPVYLEPFPVWELSQYAGERPLVIEQSSTGQFASLLSEKARIDASSVITRYDGRPFEPNELAGEIAAAGAGA
jgi:2-oxoglutarate ferredoxin oxidoreductase subunit alpha